jgi:hypothetical protein
MMLSVAVSSLSGNLKSGANSGAKSARDLCSTVKELIQCHLVVLELLLSVLLTADYAEQ